MEGLVGISKSIHVLYETCCTRRVVEVTKSRVAVDSQD